MFKLIKTILKNLFSAPPTRKYPYVIRETFKGYRGHIGVDIDNCAFCGACQKQCPVGAITVDRETKSWEIDPFKCITCGYCTEKCPKKCLITNVEYTKASDKKTVNKHIKEEK